MVRFDESRHLYITDAGRELCGITSILRRAGLLPAIQPDPEALARGSRVHLAIAFDLDGDLNEASMLPEEMGCVEAARLARKELGIVIPQGAAELVVANEPYGYATRIDAIGTWRGKKVAINWKSGSAMFPHYPIQMALEVLCLPDPHERLGIHVMKDGKYKFQHYQDRKDFAVAKAAITLATWKSQNGNGEAL